MEVNKRKAQSGCRGKAGFMNVGEASLGSWLYEDAEHGAGWTLGYT